MQRGLGWCNRTIGLSNLRGGERAGRNSADNVAVAYASHRKAGDSRFMPETATPVTAPPVQHPGLGALLVPYRGIIGLLVVLTVAGNTLNLLIPRLVANAIDSYSRHALVVAVVAPELLLAAIGIFVFAYL